jgi:hypothetical protein
VMYSRIFVRLVFSRCMVASVSGVQPGFYARTLLCTPKTCQPGFPDAGATLALATGAIPPDNRRIRESRSAAPTQARGNGPFHALEPPPSRSRSSGAADRRPGRPPSGPVHSGMNRRSPASSCSSPRRPRPVSRDGTKKWNKPRERRGARSGILESLANRLSSPLSRLPVPMMILLANSSGASGTKDSTSQPIPILPDSGRTVPGGNSPTASDDCETPTHTHFQRGGFSLMMDEDAGGPPGEKPRWPYARPSQG